MGPVLAAVAAARGPFAALWSGGASGADSLCASWAVSVGLPVRVWPADWSLGPSAGPRRSAALLAAAPAGSVVVCFVPGSLASSPGSAATVALARRRGLPVFLVSSENPSGAWLGGSQLSLF